MKVVSTVMALKDIKIYKPREVSLNISSIIDEAEDVGAVFIARRGRIQALIIPTTLQGMLNALDCYEEYLDLEENEQIETLQPDIQKIRETFIRLLREDLARVRTKQTIFRESVQNKEIEEDELTTPATE